MDRDEILNVVIKHIRFNSTGLENITIDPALSMADYGVSSLDIVETVSASMRELRIKIPRRDLANLKNINELVDAFANARLASEETIGHGR
ncbi:MAG: phosphopantetheine-binding protein [Chloroflexi bacterium]|nr:phosphopantetheine-binding protein [Chloroflexota bacterium]MCI0581191.1 phosphopantetheine-binding protein [Chloroflexota bacterium]MCI0644115.1 phosphopantetheine-binding protein [Chloroflexota bacterium]MCI0731736.1 phosphopantetheine-binding protein [Chloroflexota bacterium]